MTVSNCRPGLVHGHDLDRAVPAAVGAATAARCRFQRAHVDRAVRRGARPAGTGFPRRGDGQPVAGPPRRRQQASTQAAKGMAPESLRASAGRRRPGAGVRTRPRPARRARVVPARSSAQRAARRTDEPAGVCEAADSGSGSRSALQQHGHGRDVILAEQALQRRSGSGRRTARGQKPGQPVGRMRQRHHQAGRRRHQVHRAAADALLRQPARQVAQMAARAHQHRHGMLAAPFERLPHQRHRDVLGLLLGGLGVARDQAGWNSTAVPERIMKGRRRAVGDGARDRIVAARHQADEGTIHPVHHAGLRTEVVGEVQKFRLAASPRPLPNLRNRRTSALRKR